MSASTLLVVFLIGHAENVARPQYVCILALGDSTGLKSQLYYEYNIVGGPGSKWALVTAS